jgi:hypothetical protein
VTEAVKNVRDGLDQLVEDVVNRMVNPEQWEKELQGQTSEPAS